MDVSKELKKKQDEKASEIWTGNDPSAVKCRTCVFALPDTEYTVGAEKSNCEIYEEGEEDKPVDVLWYGADCDYYTNMEDLYGDND